jgi:hypothetical protein
MAAPVCLSIHQFCDQNGVPYQAGTIATYVVGTTTPKATYLDEGLTVLNTNPVVLDSAGRAIMWGDGDFRLILSDVSGNLIWDTTATSIVSAAMDPVVSAPTIADALDQLGVTALIDAEATARANADSAEQSARIAADNTLQTNINNEATTRANADTTLQNNINAETARAEAAEAALHGGTSGAGAVRAGSLTTDASGNFSVTFSPVFANACVYFAVVDPHATVDSDTGLFTGFIKVYGWPGSSGPGSVSATGVSGQLIYQQMPTGGPNSPLAITTATTINWWAAGYAFLLAILGSAFV